MRFLSKDAQMLERADRSALIAELHRSIKTLAAIEKTLGDR